MIRLVILVLLALPTMAQAAGRPNPLVKTNPSDVSVCPDGFGECHLTVVDNTLCIFLSELFDPSVESFHDRYNCDNHEEGVYLCVNVLGRRLSDGEVRTDYTYPYLLELAGDYERQLDFCLAAWQKSRSIGDNRQSISYRLKRRSVTLSILPFESSTVSYDRLMLEIRDPPFGR